MSSEFSAHAPVRTADAGGWTDTWFAERGIVSNVAVDPGVSVKVLLNDPAVQSDQVRVLALGEDTREPVGGVWTDPLLGAVFHGLPGGSSLSIEAAVPAGSGLGTSAAVAVAGVALVDTINRFLAGESTTRVDPLAIAHRAHRIESSIGRQSGVQDHAAAALGGVHRWDITYPDFRIDDSIADATVLASLDERLIVVYLGAPHESSQLHEMVIRDLETGRDTQRILQPLREAAFNAHEALRVGDLSRYGQALVANHEAQRTLHRDLISDLADTVITAAALAGACGWKVNGAGGAGGSLTLLSGPGVDARERILAAAQSVPGANVLPVRLSREGLRVFRLPSHDQ